MNDLLINIFNRINRAEHLLTQTYTLLKDPKILLAVLENIYLAVNEFIEYKIDEDLSHEQKYIIFKKSYSEDIGFINEIKNLWDIKQNSAVDFEKDGKLHLCSNEFEMKIISYDLMKKYIFKIKKLIEKGL